MCDLINHCRIDFACRADGEFRVAYCHTGNLFIMAKAISTLSHSNICTHTLKPLSSQQNEKKNESKHSDGVFKTEGGKERRTVLNEFTHTHTHIMVIGERVLMIYINSPLDPSHLSLTPSSTHLSPVPWFTSTLHLHVSVM